MLNPSVPRSYTRPSKLSNELRYEDAQTSSVDSDVQIETDAETSKSQTFATTAQDGTVPDSLQIGSKQAPSQHVHTSSTVSSTSSVSTHSTIGTHSSVNSTTTLHSSGSGSGSSSGSNSEFVHASPAESLSTLNRLEYMSDTNAYCMSLNPPTRLADSCSRSAISTSTLTPPDHVAINVTSATSSSLSPPPDPGYFNTDHHQNEPSNTSDSSKDSVKRTVNTASSSPYENGLHIPALVRPDIMRFHSLPSYATLSPTRQHFRLSNVAPREIKETLNAATSDIEGLKTINQYELHEVAGQGSLGLVQVGIDRVTGLKCAIKQFSKSQLRKKRRTEFLHKRKMMRGGRNVAPSHFEQDSTPIDLIRREVAIMKKLDHPNIVNLIEVLDDAQSDNLYMILEWCGKGVILPTTLEPGGPDGGKTNLYSRSPYSDEQCRLYFRDMILGIEYLHSQGIVHRDIKAENVLVSDDDVVKIVDFGVSEMFDNGAASDLYLTNHAGSPAYMAPELLKLRTMGRKPNSDDLADHISGRATDIWSIGIVLYYIRFGFLPFVSETLNELYDKIMSDVVRFPDDASDDLKDLLCKILEKDPSKRITMPVLREHPWVTKGGDDELLSTEENCDNITPITEEDIHTAIEHIEGYLDPSEATEQLRKLHGWRGSLTGASNASSRVSSPGAAASVAPELVNPQDFARHDSVSVAKLTRALDEIMIKQEKVRTHISYDDLRNTRPTLSTSSSGSEHSEKSESSVGRLPRPVDASFKWTEQQRSKSLEAQERV